MPDVRSQIEAWVLPLAEEQGAYLVDISIRSEHRRKVIQVSVDTDRGIGIDQCALISRGLAKQLEAVELFPGPYQLEVSSPGLDKPLRLLRQYPKNIGRIFRVRYREGDMVQELTGTLAAVDGAQLTFTTESGAAHTLNFETIVESKEKLPW